MIWGTCVASCGNKIKEWTEQCDDGNTTNWDGCSATCEIEKVEICNDGLDNDGDGKKDCTDPDCACNKLSINCSTKLYSIKSIWL